MNRRYFLRTAAVAASVAVLAPKRVGAARFVTPATATPGIIEVGNTRQVFLDDILIHEASLIGRFMKRPQKYEKNPVLTGEMPWEQRIDGQELDNSVLIAGQSVLYDKEENVFKLWYMAAGQDEKWSSGSTSLCYATSKDGYHWNRPALGLIDYKGSTQNNIVMVFRDPQYFNVVKDSQDKDPQRRYKAMGELEGTVANHTGGVAVAFSPDGLRWTEYDKNPVVKHGRNLGDAPSMLGWDPRRHKYVGYFRPGHSLAPEIYGKGDHRHIRGIGYAESDDFVHWTPTVPMLTPDDQDRPDTQFVQFTSGIDGEFYIGFNAIYQTHEQTWDIYLMSSRDGFHWNWIDRRVPFLGRGEVGTYDAGYMCPNGPIFHDGKVWIFYRSVSGAHSVNVSNVLGRSRTAIALCTLPQNRWMGLLAGPNRGTIVTRPLVFKGNKLIVDLDASLPLSKPHVPPRFDECEIRAAIEDQSGGRIDGFTIEDSSVLTKSGPQELSWKGANIGSLAGRPVRLRIEMRNAVLFSIQFA